jgi:hypothetical protein
MKDVQIDVRRRVWAKGQEISWLSLRRDTRLIVKADSRSVTISRPVSYSRSSRSETLGARLKMELHAGVRTSGGICAENGAPAVTGGTPEAADATGHRTQDHSRGD